MACCLGGSCGQCDIPTLRLNSLPTTPLVFLTGSTRAGSIAARLLTPIGVIPLGLGSGIGLVVKIVGLSRPEPTPIGQFVQCLLQIILEVRHGCIYPPHRSLLTVPVIEH